MVGACLALGAAAAPAAADNDLESASPGAGAKLRNAPDQVRLTFDDILVPGGSTLSVRGPQGDATDGGTDVFGHEVSRRLKRDLPDGRYTVSWQVSGVLPSNNDEGSYSFRIGAAVPSPTPREEGASPTPTRTPSATPSAETSATPTPTRTALAPAAVSTLRPSPGPVATAAPTAAVPRPAVTAIDTRRDEWLPPPVFWWGVIVLTATAIGVAPKIRRWWLATHPPKPRRRRGLGDAGPTPAEGTALLPPEPDRPKALLTPPTGALRTPADDEHDSLYR